MQVTYRDRCWNFEKGMTVLQLLNKLQLLPESVLVMCNGQLLTEDRRVNPGDEVKVIAVVSGG